jgi:hypothetical protein
VDADDPQLAEIMSTYAPRIASAPGSSVYDVAMELYAKLVLALPALRHFDQAVMLWGSLTDAVDGPPSYARGVDDPAALIRQAATEWLALEPSKDALDDYFDRWLDWPLSLAP